MTHPLSTSLSRRALASLAAFSALVGGLRGASAGEPTPPISSDRETYSISARANSDFKAGFGVESRVQSYDYEKVCAWASASATRKQCDTLASDLAPVCKSSLDSAKAQYCNIKGKYYGAVGEGEATATVLGKSVDLLAITGWAIADYNVFRTGLRFSVLDKAIFSYTQKSVAQINMFQYQTLVSASRTIWVGPVPLYAEAEAVGVIGLSLTVGLGTSQLDAEIRPSAGIEAEVGCGVGVDFAKAGASGELNLITLSLPARGHLNWANYPAISYGGDINFEVGALDGKISLGAWLFGESIASYTLVEWPGVLWSTKDDGSSLYDFSGGFSL